MLHLVFQVPCSLRILRVGIHDIGAPEGPVRRSTRTIRQLHDVEVESNLTNAGGGPATVLEHADVSGLEDRLGVFTYSPEEGTRAFDLPGAVAPELAEERRAELMAAQQPVHFAHADAQVGRVLDVLLEEVELLAKRGRGRTQHDAPDVDGTVRIRGLENGRPGAVIPVRIVAREDYDLVGEPVGHDG